jgi:hypothetical protein
MNGKILATGLMWLVAALIANGASQAVHAQVTTLDPNDFAPGTNVSGAFAGVTLESFRLNVIGSVPNDGNPIPLYAPILAPVYAASLTGSLAVPSVFSSTPTAQVWYEMAELGGACFTACTEVTGIPAPGGLGTLLLISFANPVSSVSVLDDGNAQNGLEMEAFNTSNQEIGNCNVNGLGVQPLGNYGCYSVLGDAPGGGEASEQVETTLSGTPSGGGISKILIGGQNVGEYMSTIQYTSAPNTFGAPEIDPTSAASGLTLLLGSLLVLRGRRARI